MWRELILKLTPPLESFPGAEPGPDFFPGAIPSVLASVERQLRVSLPPDLRDLLHESNGVFVCYGQHFVWSTDEILRENLSFWSNGGGYELPPDPFKHYLFFADSGFDGIRFAFPLRLGFMGHDVYAWYPLANEWVWKAPSLRAYIEGWLAGDLTV